MHPDPDLLILLRGYPRDGLPKRVTNAYLPRQMNGIILAGGAGSRPKQLTLVASEPLQPVADKPMVYYPLTTLTASGVREFCPISTSDDLRRFRQLLGDGQVRDISIENRGQSKPAGIAPAFLIAESFIGRDSVTLIYGDNIFFGGDAFPRASVEFRGGATTFACYVALRCAFVNREQFEQLITRMPDWEYRDCLRYVLAEVSRGH